MLKHGEVYLPQNEENCICYALNFQSFYGEHAPTPLKSASSLKSKTLKTPLITWTGYMLFLGHKYYSNGTINDQIFNFINFNSWAIISPEIKA